MSKLYYHRQILCLMASIVIARFSCPGAIFEQRHMDSCRNMDSFKKRSIFKIGEGAVLAIIKKTRMVMTSVSHLHTIRVSAPVLSCYR